MPASMHISVMLNQTCSASSSVHCCPCNMNIEKKKCIIVKQKLVIEFKNIIGQYRHAWYLQTQLLEILYTFLLLLSLNILHMSAADTDMRNELQICFAWKKELRGSIVKWQTVWKDKDKRRQTCALIKKKETLYISCTSENEIICESVHTSVSFCLCHFAPFIISLCFKTN